MHLRLLLGAACAFKYLVCRSCLKAFPAVALEYFIGLEVSIVGQNSALSKLDVRPRHLMRRGSQARTHSIAEQCDTVKRN